MIATGCDANHFSLVEELLASLLAIEFREFDIGFVQVGATEAPASITSAADVVARVPTDNPILPTEGFQLAYLAVKARLPELFPNYETYVWLDGDTWVQNAEGLTQIICGAQTADICIHPQIDVNYLACRFPDDYTLSTYLTIFGEEAKDRFARFPMINTGVFGATALSPIWKAWESLLVEIREQLQPREHRFFSDQIPLHKLIYSGGISVTPLRAVNNWLVLHGVPRLDPASGELTAPSFPYERINIIHLVGPSKWATYKWNGKNISLRYFAMREHLGQRRG